MVRSRCSTTTPQGTTRVSTMLILKSAPEVCCCCRAVLADSSLSRLPGTKRGVSTFSILQTLENSTLRTRKFRSSFSQAAKLASLDREPQVRMVRLGNGSTGTRHTGMAISISLLRTLIFGNTVFRAAHYPRPLHRAQQQHLGIAEPTPSCRPM